MVDEESIVFNNSKIAKPHSRVVLKMLATEPISIEHGKCTLC